MNIATEIVLAQGAPVGPQVYRILRERIIRAELTPGMLISESEIARMFSLSRQPVREAFIKLAEEGLLEVRPQRGTLVRKITKAAVMDARFVREAIEADIVKLVASEHDGALVRELREQVKRQRAVPEDDPATFMKLDEFFHRTLAEAADKSYAWKVLEDVKAQMDRVRYLSFIHFPIPKIVNQHAAIVDAIERGEPEEADRAMRLHLREILSDLPGIAGVRPEFFEEPG
ncbi:GntR family transcriptional regulator [Rhizobium sp. TRM95111]|uniref:GntR family transcriptional regulator n=1 Tax=Rhizobium alarense TaxID=2846851 RepID=UPI001F19BAEB|nr:GntR family transcriptional regulator [Rhizobium alarense]MCF3640265.1 GntR family transcriptional regulator [Rhizobium alarense]